MLVPGLARGGAQQPHPPLPSFDFHLPKAGWRWNAPWELPSCCLRHATRGELCWSPSEALGSGPAAADLTAVCENCLMMAAVHRLLTQAEQEVGATPRRCAHAWRGGAARGSRCGPHFSRICERDAAYPISTG